MGCLLLRSFTIYLSGFLPRERKVSSAVYFQFQSEFKIFSKSKLGTAFKIHNGWPRGGCEGSQFDLWQIVLAGLASCYKKPRSRLKSTQFGRWVGGNICLRPQGRSEAGAASFSAIGSHESRGLTSG